LTHRLEALQGKLITEERRITNKTRDFKFEMFERSGMME
jgi:hypothetical protein